MRFAPLVAIAASFLILACGDEAQVEKEAMTENSDALPTIEDLWNFREPEETRARFEALLKEHETTAPPAWSLEIKTQIARTHSLKREFDEAHGLLDEVQVAMAHKGDNVEGYDRARVRYLLERGRALNSAGNKSDAKPMFEEAFYLAVSGSEDFLAVDAAHMVAIVASGTPDAGTWSERGLTVARASADERARGWVGAISNNMGWDAFDAGNYDEALALFEESRASFAERDRTAQARIARWSIARVMRAQGNLDKALALQLEIERENEAEGTPDGYNFEELGEIYLAKGEAVKAAPYFARAHDLLSGDAWFAENEATRLARLKSLSKP